MLKHVLTKFGKCLWPNIDQPCTKNSANTLSYLSLKASSRISQTPTRNIVVEPPSWKKIRRPAGVSCGSCLFVVVLSVVSWSFSRLSHWRRFLPRPTWTHPPSSSPFRLHLSLRCGGLNSAHASLNTGLVLHILLSFRWLFPLLMFAIGLLRCFLCPILDPLAFAPNTFYTHNLSKYGLFQSLPQYGLFQNPGLHTCFGLNLNRGLNKTNVFPPKPSFAQRAVLHKTVLSTNNTMFYTKTMFLLGLCKCCLQLTG